MSRKQLVFTIKHMSIAVALGLILEKLIGAPGTASIVFGMYPIVGLIGFEILK